MNSSFSSFVYPSSSAGVIRADTSSFFLTFLGVDGFLRWFLVGVTMGVFAFDDLGVEGCFKEDFLRVGVPGASLDFFLGVFWGDEGGLTEIVDEERFDGDFGAPRPFWTVTASAADALRFATGDFDIINRGSVRVVIF